MGIIKDVVKRMKKTVVQAQRPDKLIKWQKRLESAKSGQDLAIMDKREYLYLGDRTVDKNVNATTKPSKASNNIYNIIFEFIETGANKQIPMPSVKSKREGFEAQAQMIEDSIGNDMKESDIDVIDDQNERITPVQGISVIEVAWNPNFKHHLYRGEIELYGRHPKQLVTQPKVFSLQKMDYFFILSNVTKDFVKRRYKKNLAGEEEQYPENTRLFDTDQAASGAVTQRGAGETEEEPLTEIVCWYKDEDGDIGRYVWINDTELEDLPKFFYRRLDHCTNCGEVRADDENSMPVQACTRCGNTKFEKKITETEKLDRDIQLSDGSTAQVGEEVPYFIPTRYPVSVRINVPKNFSFGGQSDVDVIRDQQDSIKRVVHKMEEKLVKGGTIITAQDDHATFKISDEIYQIIKGTPQQLSMLKTLDLTADITRDIQFVQEQYRVAQSMLGITNSFQGKEDPTAQSGKAKQIQVQQASGRLQSKLFNKYVHYKEIFEIIFEFKLALYDELRPYLTTDQNGNAAYGEFDKYKFLQRDKAGKLYYNTDFIFGTDGSFGLPKDPMFMYEQTMALFQAQAIDITQLWTILESLKFPQASKIKAQLEQKMDQQGQMQQTGEQLQQLQQQNAELTAQLQQAMQEAQHAQETNVQSEVEAIKAHHEGEKQAHEQRSQTEDREHQRQVDAAKLMIEQQKVDAANRPKVPT